MTARADDSPTRVERVVAGATLAIGLALIAAHLLGAFVGLSASSLWADELVSRWIVDTPDLPTTWARIFADVHPPLYSSALKGWSLIFGLDEVGLRSFSATCATMAVLVLFFGARRHLSLESRVLCALTAVCSGFWFEQSQNARMYGLGLLTGSVLAVVALHLSDRLRSGRARPRDYLSLLAAGLAAAFTHMYLFLAAGATLGVLLLMARRWSERIVLAACGLVILGCVLAFIQAMLASTIVDTKNQWFENDFATLQRALRGSFSIQLGKAAMALMALAGAALVLRGRALLGAHEGGHTLRVLALGASVPLLVAAAGVTVSLLFTPSLSDRNAAVAAPWTWLLVGALFDVVSGAPARRWRPWLFAGLVLATAWGGREILYRLTPSREEWRGSAHYVSGLKACAARPVPIVYPGAPSGESAVHIWALYLYRHYLAEPPPRALPIVETAEGPVFFIPDDVARIMAARLSGEDPCPILLWVVHGRQEEGPMIAAVRKAAGVPDAAIQVKRFPHYAPQPHKWAVGARVLLVAPAKPPAP